MYKHENDDSLQMMTHFVLTRTGEGSRTSASRKQFLATSRWRLCHATTGGENVRGQVPSYHADTIVTKWLLKLLVQYAGSSGDAYLQKRFREDGIISPGNLEIVVQDHITLGGGFGAFEGFETFTIHATSSFGRGDTALQKITSTTRDRFDLVEVTIPIECEGKIAGNKHLLRTSDEFAIAQVRAIVVLKLAHTEVPLLFLMFLRKGYSSQGADCPKGINKDTNKRLLEYIPRLGMVEYGCPVKEWVALYPIVTLKAPVLGVKDFTHPGFFHVFPLRYLSRENWFDQHIHEQFESRVLSINERLTERTGELMRNSRQIIQGGGGGVGTEHSYQNDLDVDEEDSLGDLDDEWWDA